MVVSRSAMNNTGLWYRGGEVFDQCNSALKGCPKRLIVEYSVFAHNHATGVDCKSAALFLRSKAITSFFRVSLFNDRQKPSRQAGKKKKKTLKKSVFE